MDGKITAENLEVLAKITIQLCDVVTICAPPFAPGSRGAKTVAMARDIRPRLVAMLGDFDQNAKHEEEE